MNETRTETVWNRLAAGNMIKKRSVNGEMGPEQREYLIDLLHTLNTAVTLVPRTQHHYRMTTLRRWAT